MPVSLYATKKALLAPRTRLMRRRDATEDKFLRAALELHYYRRPMYAWIEASRAKPDLLHDFPLGDGAVILDVGAYMGEWAVSVAQRHPDARIYSFEPGPPFFRRLADAAADHPNVTPLMYGLGARDETASLALDGPGATLYGGQAVFGSAEVEIRDVAGVLDELGHDTIDLMKVNIEGAEYDVFDRIIEVGWLPRIRNVVVQFHEWHPKAYARRRAIRRALRRRHREVWNYPWVWEYWRRTESG